QPQTADGWHGPRAVDRQDDCRGPRWRPGSAQSGGIGQRVCDDPSALGAYGLDDADAAADAEADAAGVGVTDGAVPTDAGWLKPNQCSPANPQKRTTSTTINRTTVTITTTGPAPAPGSSSTTAMAGLCHAGAI